MEIRRPKWNVRNWIFPEYKPQLSVSMYTLIVQVSKISITNARCSERNERRLWILPNIL